jgi:hypothetical protein
MDTPRADALLAADGKSFFSEGSSTIFDFGEWKSEIRWQFLLMKHWHNAWQKLCAFLSFGWYYE